MAHYRNKYFLMSLLAVLILSACKKNWNQRDKVTDQRFDINLLQQIKANPNLTTFARLLSKGFGYDQLLTSSKNFTVFAPVNTAFQGVDTSFLDGSGKVIDTVKYKRFMGNHIVNQSYLTSSIQTSVRLRTLNGKYVTFTPTTVESANIVTADQYVGNGVLDIISQVLVPKLNIDEYITSLGISGVTMQKAYVRGQDSSYVDTTTAIVKSIDPVTGKPILVPGTGVVSLNKYYNKVGNLASEDSLYTYFILNDQAYQAEIAKVKPYFATSSADTTNRLAAYNVLKDVVVKGKITQANLVALKSVKGKPVPINTSAIVSSYEASNGMVYIVNSLSFDVKNKIDTITIQGENPSFYARTDKAGGANTNTQVLSFTDENGKFGQELWINPGTTNSSAFFAAYTLSRLNTCQYRVFYRAYNDTAKFTHIPTATPPGNGKNPNGSGVISETIKFGSIKSIAPDPTSGTLVPVFLVSFPYFNIQPVPDQTVSNPVKPNTPQVEATGATASGNNTILSVVGGRLNVVRINSVNLYIIGAANTNNNLNEILMDYVKLVPIIN